MHGKGVLFLFRTLKRERVCSNTQVFETLSRSASSCGVRRSAGLIGAGAGFGVVAISYYGFIF